MALRQENPAVQGSGGVAFAAPVRRWSGRVWPTAAAGTEVGSYRVPPPGPSKCLLG